MRFYERNRGAIARLKRAAYYSMSPYKRKRDRHCAQTFARFFPRTLLIGATPEKQLNSDCIVSFPLRASNVASYRTVLKIIKSIRKMLLLGNAILISRQREPRPEFESVTLDVSMTARLIDLEHVPLFL